MTIICSEAVLTIKSELNQRSCRVYYVDYLICVVLARCRKHTDLVALSTLYQAVVDVRTQVDSDWHVLYLDFSLSTNGLSR